MRRVPLVLLFVIQAVSAFYFVSGIVLSVLGIQVPMLNWQAHEMLEIGAAVGLSAGLVFGAQALVRARRKAEDVEAQLRRVSSAFTEIIDQRFSKWALTPAERDVAHFLIKGFSIQEIAGFRGTSDGTVKAQTAAIYKKAGVKGRAQFLSLFLDDLMDEDRPFGTAQLSRSSTA